MQSCIYNVIDKLLTLTNMTEFIHSTSLLLVLLNPFLVIVYLADVVQKLSLRAFSKVLFRAAAISIPVFWCFALLGNAIFSSIIQAEFASFQIFGGIVFILIGIQFVFKGNVAIEILRGESEHLAGAIAMPVIIGPGTISASVLVGQRLEAPVACAAILMAVGLSVGIMVALKHLHDFVRPRNEALVKRYIEVAGRLTALFVGTISVEMIMQGLSTWLHKLL